MAAFVIVACFVLFGLTAIPIHRMIPIKDDTMLSPFFKLPTLQTDQLITLPFLFCCVWLFVCFAFAFVFGWFFVLVCLVVLFAFFFLSAS